MSYFTETFEYVLNEASDSDIKKYRTKRFIKSMLIPAPLSLVIRYPNKLVYIAKNGKTYHGMNAYSYLFSDYIIEKKGKDASFEDRMKINKQVNDKIDGAVVDKEYDLNKVFNLYLYK